MTSREADEHLGALLDAVVAADRELAVVAARRAVLIEAVRAWSVESVDAVAQGRGESGGTVADHRVAERSTIAELGCALRVPEGAASALVVESQALVREHPATMAALREGAVSYRHAQAVLGATSGLDETATLTLDAVLSERARTSTVAGLKRVARRERERHDTRPLVERHTVAAKERTVELQSCRDGMAWLHQYLPVVQATAIFNRLTDIALAVQGPDEPRTLAQLRADASVDLLLDDDTRTALASVVTPAGSGTGLNRTTTTNANLSARAGAGAGAGGDGDDHRDVRGSDSGADRAPGSNDTPTADDAQATSIARVADKISLRGIRPHVAVTVPVMTLLGHSEEPGDLAGHGPIDANTARHLAAQAPTFLRLLTHPETGTVLSVGREKYVVPADLRSWLQVRDETCRFPGCSRRAARCDVDHITDWAHGGPTDHHNLIHLCRKHHRLKHTTTWTVHTHTDPDRTPSPPRRSPSPPGDTSTRPGVPLNHAHNQAQHTHAPRQAHHTREPTSRAATTHHPAPSADVVRWTTPTGRTYLDHAAVEIATAEAQIGRRQQAASGVDRGRQTGQLIVDESRFDGPPPF